MSVNEWIKMHPCHTHGCTDLAYEDESYCTRCQEEIEAMRRGQWIDRQAEIDAWDIHSTTFAKFVLLMALACAIYNVGRFLRWWD